METSWRKRRGRGHCCSETAGPCGNWGCKGIGASIIKDAEKEEGGWGWGLCPITHGAYGYQSLVGCSSH